MTGTVYQRALLPERGMTAQATIYGSVRGLTDDPYGYIRVVLGHLGEFCAALVVHPAFDLIKGDRAIRRGNLEVGRIQQRRTDRGTEVEGPRFIRPCRYLALLQEQVQVARPVCFPAGSEVAPAKIRPFAAVCARIGTFSRRGVLYAEAAARAVAPHAAPNARLHGVKERPTHRTGTLLMRAARPVVVVRAPFAYPAARHTTVPIPGVGYWLAADKAACTSRQRHLRLGGTCRGAILAATVFYPRGVGFKGGAALPADAWNLGDEVVVSLPSYPLPATGVRAEAELATTYAGRGRMEGAPTVLTDAIEGRGGAMLRLHRVANPFPVHGWAGVTAPVHLHFTPSGATCRAHRVGWVHGHMDSAAKDVARDTLLESWGWAVHRVPTDADDPTVGRMVDVALESVRRRRKEGRSDG